MSLKGAARYRGARRQEEEEIFGPMVQTVDSTKLSFRFDNIPPNTNYTVTVSADTRTQSGLSAHATCQMPWTLPDKEALSNVSFSRYQKSDIWGLRVNLPRVSERRGPICCYSVVVVKILEGQSINNLPEPHLLPLYTYDDVHRQGAGAYIAKLFDANSVPERILLGDGSVFDVDHLPCRSCKGIFFASQDLDSKNHSEIPTHMINIAMLSKDGRLNPDSNYTTFIRVKKIILQILETQSNVYFYV